MPKRRRRREQHEGEEERGGDVQEDEWNVPGKSIGMRNVTVYFKEQGCVHGQESDSNQFALRLKDRYNLTTEDRIDGPTE